MATLDYAQLFETDYRPRRRSVKRFAARTLWFGLLLVRPRLALQILRDRR